MVSLTDSATAQEQGLLAFLFAGSDGEYQALEYARSRIFMQQMGRAIVGSHGNVLGTLLFATMTSVDMQGMVLVDAAELEPYEMEDEPEASEPLINKDKGSGGGHSRVAPEPGVETVAPTGGKARTVVKYQG